MQFLPTSPPIEGALLQDKKVEASERVPFKSSDVCVAVVSLLSEGSDVITPCEVFTCLHEPSKGRVS